MKYVIGLDIGTTHCKSVAFGIDGQLLGQWQSGYPTIQYAEGQSEQEPDAIFNKVVELLATTIRTNNREHELVAIGFSSAMHSIIPVDKSGIPLTNAFTWADTRSEPWARKLLTAGKQELLYPSIGVPIHPMLPLCKIIWIRQSMPTIFSIAKKFISIKEYIFFKFFGKYIVDYSIASASGLFNINELIWDETALKLAGIDSNRLSVPVPVDHSESALKDEYKTKLGITSKIQFLIGGSDGCLANIGSGAVDKGEGAITIGTSGAVRIVANHSNPDPLHRLFNYVVNKNFFVCGGPVNNGGIVLKWFAENFLGRKFESGADFNWFLDDVMQIEAGANGLLFLPFLLGERAPYWDATLKAAFIGLEPGHRKEHMMRAVVEGVCFGLCSVMKATEDTHGSLHTLYASGGFTNSKHWIQILADIVNKKIVVTGDADASAMGAIMVALLATGNIKDLREAKRFAVTNATYQPNPDIHELYQKQFKSFEALASQIQNYQKASASSAVV